MKHTARLQITEAENVSWAKAISKYFGMIGLCAHLDILRATPAIEFKRLAIESIIKKMKALEAKT